MPISLMKEANEIIRTQPMTLKIGHLKQCTEKLHEAYDVLKVLPSRAAITDFIAHANRCILAIDMIHGDNPIEPQGGKMPVTENKQQAATRRP